MTGEEFTQLWKNTELRQYILDESKKRNKLPQLQEEYCQEAWMLISCAPAGYDLASYRELAYKAIRSSWWQTKKEFLIMRSMEQHINARMCKTREEETDNEPYFMAGEDHRRD